MQSLLTVEASSKLPLCISIHVTLHCSCRAPLSGKAQNILFTAPASIHEAAIKSPYLFCVCSLPAVTAAMGSVVQREQ